MSLEENKKKKEKKTVFEDDCLGGFYSIERVFFLAGRSTMFDVLKSSDLLGLICLLCRKAGWGVREAGWKHE